MTIRLPGQPLATLAGLSHDEWLDLRRGGIGSSDAPAVAGVDPWRSPYAVWAEKVATDWPDIDNDAMFWGRRLESVVAHHFADTTGMDVRTPPCMYVHPEHEWMRASPDRFVVNRDLNPIAVLEVKTTGDWAAWDDDQPPDRVLVQVHHQLEVMGLHEAWVAVLIQGRHYRHYHVKSNPELAEYLVQIEAEFWQRVVDHDPPPIDGSRSTTDAIRDLYATADPGAERLLDAEIVALIDELRHTRALAKQMDEDAQRLENEIKAALGDAEVGVFDGEPVVTWKTSTSRRVDTSALKAAHPDLAAEFTTETTSRRFLLPKGTR